MSNQEIKPAENFCNCPVTKCPRHPANHTNGCTPCIEDNLKRKKMPACFFRVVNDDVSDVRDFTIAGFVAHYNRHTGNNQAFDEE